MGKTAIISSTVSDANTKTKGWLNIVIMAIVIIAIVMIVKAIYTASKTGGLALGSELGKQIVQMQTGIQPARQSVCEDVAINVRDAMTCIYGTNVILWANPDSIIASLNRLVSSAEGSLSSLYFKQKNGVSMLSQINSLVGKTKILPRVTPDVRAGLI